MDEKTRLEVALFRFSLIAPLVNGSLEGTVQDYVETVCAKSYDVPGVGQRQFSPRTLLAWRALYRTHGLEGLKMKRRSDRGSFRRLSPEAQEFLVRAVQHNPRRTATGLYEELAQARLLGRPPVSLSTVQRFLRTVEAPSDATPERRRFAFPHANDCWQSDLCAGPYLLEKARSAKPTSSPFSTTPPASSSRPGSVCSPTIGSTSLVPCKIVFRFVSTPKPESGCDTSFAQIRFDRLRMSFRRAFSTKSSVSAAKPTLTNASGSSKRKSSFSISTARSLTAHPLLPIVRLATPSFDISGSRIS